MDLVVLVLITFVAATVNGALGYGFSSITVPVTLLFYTNRILNPALVLVELVINGYVLFINRKSIPNIWWRVSPILIGLVIGVAIGSYILSLVHPAWVKFVTYFMLLPLILLQAAGIRKPIQAEKTIAIPSGLPSEPSIPSQPSRGIPLPCCSTIKAMPNRISVPRWGSFEWEKRSSRESPTISLGSIATIAWRSFPISSPVSCWEFPSDTISFVGWILNRSGGFAWPSMP